MIPYGRQDISQQDINAVLEVLQSDFLTQGPRVPDFEEAILKYCQVKHAVAVNSATSALHLACLALGLQKGDWLWTTPVTFVASANCGLYCGAKVDFVDIDERTYNISVTALEKKLRTASEKNRLPKIIVPVHLTGQPCQMREISELAKKYDVKIIEDASHAIGGKYMDKPIGSCQYSDITIFSFHPVKIITSAEGGVAVTNYKQVAEKMKLLRSHGITRDPALMRGETDGGWYYQQIDLGFNYRMTELQAALGISQMARLNDFVQRRHQLAERYDEHLEKLPVRIPYQHPEGYSGRHLYVIRLKLNMINSTHREVYEGMREKGVGVNLHYIPIHTQPYYSDFGFKKGDFPEAENYYKEAISLPLYPGLAEEKQDYVISVLKELM